MKNSKATNNPLAKSYKNVKASEVTSTSKNATQLQSSNPEMKSLFF